MDYLTVRQAAAAIGLSRRGLLERIERGAIRAERVSARLWLIPRAEVERAKEQGRLKPGPKPGTRRTRRPAPERTLERPAD